MKLCPVCGTEYGDDAAFCSRDRSPLRPAEGRESQGLVGQLVGERYQVERRLGEGGMGEVYLARHVLMGRACALKVMSQALSKDPDAVSRFNREATNASRISHPNVCVVYDFGLTSEGLVYLAMEYIEGRTLSVLLDESGPMPVARAARLVAQCAAGLSAAHDLGIVHRDLKPDNIMVIAARERETAKLVDFGIAKAVQEAGGQRVTKTGFVVGTPEYMSPEQLSGDPVKGSSDQYSLALVFYRLITGRLPFEGNSLQETLVKRLTDPPRPLAQSRPDVQFPAGLQAIMDRALAREADSRYATVMEFSEAIDTVVSADEVATRKLAVRAAPAPGGSIPPTRATRAPGRGMRVAGGVAGVLLVGAAAWGIVKLTQGASADNGGADSATVGPPPAASPNPAPAPSPSPIQPAPPPPPPPAAAETPDTSELDLDALEVPARRWREIARARLLLAMPRLSTIRRARAAAYLAQVAMEANQLDSARSLFRRAYDLDPRPVYREQLRQLGDTIKP